jgi:hypothetical protein
MPGASPILVTGAAGRGIPFRLRRLTQWKSDKTGVAQYGEPEWA